MYWLVERTEGDKHYMIISADNNRERVKRIAHGWFGLNPDHYVLTPLTDENVNSMRVEVTCEI